MRRDRGRNEQMGYTLETSYRPESDEEKPSMAYAPGRRDRGRKETDGVHSGASYSPFSSSDSGL